MMTDAIVGRWHVTLRFPEKSEMAWVFDPTGSILMENVDIGRWQRLNEGFYRMTLRLGEEPAMDLAIGMERDEFSVHYCGQQIITAVRQGSNPAAPPIVTTPPEAEPKGDLYEPWIGCWVIPTGDYLELELLYARMRPSELLRTTRHDRKAAQAGVLETRADGTYSCKCEGRSGLWERTQDGRLLLDRGRDNERYYRLAPDSMNPDRIFREGPFRKDGREFYDNKRFFFVEDARRASVFPELKIPPAGTPIQVGWNGKADWRDQKSEEWRETGHWSGWVGGCRVSSRKDPHEWEHPHLK